MDTTTSQRLTYTRWELIANQKTPTGYILKCIDRKGRSGGGVALLCKQEWAPKLDSAEMFTSFEYISCVLSNSNTKLRVCVVYRPPNTENMTTGQFFQEFSELLKKRKTFDYG